MRSLENKIALITGGGQGVGQGIALALAKQGVHCVVTGRTLEKCEETARLLELRDINALALKCNVKSDTDLQKIINATIAKFGQLDILVNNAQEIVRGPLVSISDEQFKGNWESGPLATFRLMKMAYPHLKKTKGNVINLCSSVMKRWDVGTYGIYAAVESGNSTTLQGPPPMNGVRMAFASTQLCPMPNRLLLRDGLRQTPWEAEHFQRSIPLGYVGECEEDIGAFVAMMCGDGARYLSGQTIALDGGQVFIG